MFVQVWHVGGFKPEFDSGFHSDYSFRFHVFGLSTLFWIQLTHGIRFNCADLLEFSMKVAHFSPILGSGFF